MRIIALTAIAAPTTTANAASAEATDIAATVVVESPEEDPSLAPDAGMGFDAPMWVEMRRSDLKV